MTFAGCYRWSDTEKEHGDITFEFPTVKRAVSVRINSLSASSLPEGFLELGIRAERILGTINLKVKIGYCHVSHSEEYILTASVPAAVKAVLIHPYRSSSMPTLLASSKGFMNSSNFVSIVLVIESNELLGASAVCVPDEVSGISPH